MGLAPEALLLDVQELENDRVGVELDEDLANKIREIVHSDSPEGFIWLYYLCGPINPDTGGPYKLPDHCVGWIVEYYEALEAGQDLALEAINRVMGDLRW